MSKKVLLYILLLFACISVCSASGYAEIASLKNLPATSLELSNLSAQEVSTDFVQSVFSADAWNKNQDCRYFCYGEFVRANRHYFLIKKTVSTDAEPDLSAELYLSLVIDGKCVKSLLIYKSVIDVCNQVIFAISDKNVIYVTRMAEPDEGRCFIRQDAYDIDTLELIQSQSIE